MKLQIGSVPYLNAKPLVDWFHRAECGCGAEVFYAPPSALAHRLRNGELDVANVSIFELFREPGLTAIPGISISADGPVMSVRLFSKLPLQHVQAVALDSGSLTCAALTRILLTELYGASPCYINHAPDLHSMLAAADAALIIGDLHPMNLGAEIRTFDLGEEWRRLTGLPFVYAAWLARDDRVSSEMALNLLHARDWGVSRLDYLAEHWSQALNLPLARCQEYLTRVMDYSLTERHLAGLRLFQQKCFSHGLVRELLPLKFGAG